MINLETVRQEVVSRLPVHVRWIVSVWGDSLAFDFSRSLAPLCKIEQSDVSAVTSIEPEWTSLYLFGEEDFADGGGASPYLGVHQDSGEIYGLDVEREESQVFLLNSNADKFIQTFQTVEEMLRNMPVAPGTLSKALQGIDPVVFQRSEWRDLVGYVEAGT
jgi:hypothetical protein